MAQRASPAVDSGLCPVTVFSQNDPWVTRLCKECEQSLLCSECPVSSHFNPLRLIIQLCLPPRHMRNNLWSSFTFHSCSLHPTVKQNRMITGSADPGWPLDHHFLLQHFMDSTVYVKQNQMTSSHPAVYLDDMGQWP